MAQGEDRCYGYVRYATIASCAVDDTRVSDGMLRVLVTMGSYATQRNGRHVWAKQSTIAERLGISRQAINEHVTALARIGYVHVQKTTRGDGGQGTNRIRMVLDITVPDEYLRELHPHPRKGIGGRKPKPASAASDFASESDGGQREITPACSCDGADSDEASDDNAPPVNSELRPPVNSELTAPKLNGVAGGDRGSAGASGENTWGDGGSQEADFAVHPDLLSGSSNRIFQQERATVRARTSPPREVKTVIAETSPPPANLDALTTIGATEDWKTWRAVVDAVNISDAIKDAYLRRAKLYDYGDGRSLLLLAAHSNFAAEHIGRFHSTLEMLVGQRLKRCGVRLVIRPIQAVRAEEEALL